VDERSEGGRRRDLGTCGCGRVSARGKFEAVVTNTFYPTRWGRNGEEGGPVRWPRGEGAPGRCQVAREGGGARLLAAARARRRWATVRWCVAEESGKREGSDRWGHDTVLGGSSNLFEIFQTVLNTIQIHSNLIRSKKNLLELEKIKIKYGCEGFDVRNNFTYSNSFRFEMDFKLKVRKTFSI
jgi:hypothetical protein